MQYLNFGRKYEAVAVTVDISQLPVRNCLVRQAQMIGTSFFCEREESISNSLHSEEKSMEILKEKPLTLNEKLEKAIDSKTKVLYCSTKKSISFNKIMKREMQLFDSSENPSPNIIKNNVRLYKQFFQRQLKQREYFLLPEIVRHKA
ncbi:uncharacterized protein TNCV_201111 [Trichonephila clavipes]|nr:uncharacterized protein TNCV_201111 [Trichonephila clavipes]